MLKNSFFWLLYILWSFSFFNQIVRCFSGFGCNFFIVFSLWCTYNSKINITLFACFRKRTYVISNIDLCMPESNSKTIQRRASAWPSLCHVLQNFRFSRIIVFLFNFNGILVRNGVASRAFVSSFVLTLHPIGFRKWL